MQHFRGKLLGLVATDLIKGLRINIIYSQNFRVELLQT